MSDVGGASCTVRRVTEGDWATFRDLRLRMLRDTPKAYLETYEEALAVDPDGWRTRCRGLATGDSPTMLVAVSPDGRWVGAMGAALQGEARTREQQPRDVLVFTVFVDPAHRGRAAGVSDALMGAVEGWALQVARADRLVLLVHEHNARARRYYRRCGFTETGRTVPYDLDPTEREVEMVRDLRPEPDGGRKRRTAG